MEGGDGFGCKELVAGTRVDPTRDLSIASPAQPLYSAPMATMGGAAGTAGTAVAVPLLREVRQNKVLPYHGIL